MGSRRFGFLETDRFAEARKRNFHTCWFFSKFLFDFFQPLSYHSHMIVEVLVELELVTDQLAESLFPSIQPISQLNLSDWICLCRIC
jgi:hypothetical protein